MSGASFGKAPGILPCLTMSLGALADVRREYNFVACLARCRCTASLCPAAARCWAVARASGGFQISEYVPAPKAAGANAAAN